MKKLDREILKVISNHTPFGFIELEQGYEIVDSFDDLLYAITESQRYGINLWDMCNLLMRKGFLNE